MKKSYPQYAIVVADSAQELSEELNAKLYALKGKNPEVTFEGMIARIKYFEVEEEPERRLEGNRNELKLKCGDCPMFDPVRKKDGTPDMRTTFGFCRFAEDGQTFATATACNELTRMINEKEIGLCFRER